MLAGGYKFTWEQKLVMFLSRIRNRPINYFLAWSRR